MFAFKTMFAVKTSNDILSIFRVFRLRQSNGRPSFLAMKLFSILFIQFQKFWYSMHVSFSKN